MKTRFKRQLTETKPRCECVHPGMLPLQNVHNANPGHYLQRSANNIVGFECERGYVGNCKQNAGQVATGMIRMREYLS